MITRRDVTRHRKKEEVERTIFCVILRNVLFGKSEAKDVVDKQKTISLNPNKRKNNIQHSNREGYVVTGSLWHPHG